MNIKQVVQIVCKFILMLFEHNLCFLCIFCKSHQTWCKLTSFFIQFGNDFVGIRAFSQNIRHSRMAGFALSLLHRCYKIKLRVHVHCKLYRVQSYQSSKMKIYVLEPPPPHQIKTPLFLAPPPNLTYPLPPTAAAAKREFWIFNHNTVIKPT